jgi:hypothetical protein
MLGRIDLAGSQIAHQQLIATQDIQRQNTVVIVVAMEEAPYLVAADRIVRGIKVKDYLIGRLCIGGNELLKQ